MVSKWVNSNLLLNGVYWGYNPLILTFDPNFHRAIQVGVFFCWICRIYWDIYIYITLKQMNHLWSLDIFFFGDFIFFLNFSEKVTLQGKNWLFMVYRGL